VARRERVASERRSLLAATMRQITSEAEVFSPTPESTSKSIRAPSPVVDSTATDSLVASRPGVEVGELWIALHLPRLMLDALQDRTASADAATCPRIVVECQSGVQRVIAADASALQRGILPGCSLAAALTVCPDVEAVPREPRRERRCLVRLAEALLCFTPRVSLEAPDAVLMEVQGSLALFGGFQALHELVLERVRASSLQLHLSSAPTPLAALVFARSALAQAGSGVLTAQRLVGTLAPLPLTLLRWPPDRLLRLESVKRCACRARVLQSVSVVTRCGCSIGWSVGSRNCASPSRRAACSGPAANPLSS
jgi:hypothetical protein